MSTTTPKAASNHKRSTSQSLTRSKTPPPLPTTPLRPPSRSSLRSSHTPTQGSYSAASTPISSLEPAFAELSDSMADLEANFMHMQLMHESLARFSECFASFLYGLNVNAFCVDFPEAPVPESFRRAKENSQSTQAYRDGTGTYDVGQTIHHNADPGTDADQTFLFVRSLVQSGSGPMKLNLCGRTTDTSFVDNPPSAKRSASSRFSTPGGRALANTPSRRGARGSEVTTAGRGIAGTRGRPSGLARATTRGREGGLR